MKKQLNTTALAVMATLSAPAGIWQSHKVCHHAEALLEALAVIAVTLCLSRQPTRSDLREAWLPLDDAEQSEAEFATEADNGSNTLLKSKISGCAT